MSIFNNAVTQPGVTELGNLFLSVTGGAVSYVGTAAQIAQMGDVGQGIAGRTFTSVNAALLSANVVSGRGDIIYVLPGYTESISSADAWNNLATKTDVTIIGMGRGTNRPTFTWTAADATVLMDAANFRIINCNLYLAGPQAAGAALTVAAPITVSAAGCTISDCDIFFGYDADQIVTIGITTTAAADFFEFKRNYCYGATAAECTSFMYLVGADYCRVHDNTVIGATSSTTVGVVRFITTASIGIEFLRNRFVNMKASSVHAVTQMDGVLGWCDQNCYGIFDNTTLAGWVPANAGNGPQHGHDVTANLAAENGAPMTPVSA